MDINKKFTKFLELNELSKTTLTNYAKKAKADSDAHRDMGHAVSKMDSEKNSGSLKTMRDNAYKKAADRLDGVGRAKSKIKGAEYIDDDGYGYKSKVKANEEVSKDAMEETETKGMAWHEKQKYFQNKWKKEEEDKKSKKTNEEFELEEGIVKVGAYTTKDGEPLSLHRNTADKNHHMLVNRKGESVRSFNKPTDQVHKELTSEKHSLRGGIMNEGTDWRKLAADEAAETNKTRQKHHGEMKKIAAGFPKILEKHGYKLAGHCEKTNQSVYSKFDKEKAALHTVKLNHNYPYARLYSTHAEGAAKTFGVPVHLDKEKHEEAKKTTPVKFEAAVISHGENPYYGSYHEETEFTLGDNLIEHDEYGLGNILSESDETIEVAFESGIVKLNK